MDKARIEFGTRLRKYRESAGLTQLELALACGYTSKTAISKIENGQRDMPRSIVQVAANKLGISPLLLLSEVEDTELLELNLLSIFRQLSESGKEDVLNFAEFQLQRELNTGKKEGKGQPNSSVAE